MVLQHVSKGMRKQELQSELRMPLEEHHYFSSLQIRRLALGPHDDMNAHRG